MSTEKPTSTHDFKISVVPIGDEIHTDKQHALQTEMGLVEPPGRAAVEAAKREDLDVQMNGGTTIKARRKALGFSRR